MEKKSYSKTHSALSLPAELSILFLLTQEGYQNEKNAYFIKQYMDSVGINDWVPASMVTVYKTLKRLLKFGLVKQVKGNKGNSDKEVTCYQITDKGKEYLNENLKTELGNYVQDYFRFDLSIGLSSYVPHSEKIEQIEQRVLQMRERLKELRREARNYKGGSAFGGWIILDHQINHLKSEISWMKRLIKLLKEQIK